MNKITCYKNRDYTTISNVYVRDERLSLKAKGFLTLLMTLPDDWDFSVDGIVRIVKEGRTAIYGIIDELKENKYCHLETARNEKGVITGYDYTFFECPYTENPFTENPQVDNPQAENQTQTNIIYNNNTEQNKEDEETKELKEKFFAFVKLYKKLTGKPTRNAETEFKDFSSRHKNWKKIVPYLSIAIERETKERNNAKSMRKFFPEPKMLQTYLGRQKAWEMYVDTSKPIESISNEYAPATDGNIMWNDNEKCYIFVGMYFGYIADGYSDDERPDGARIMIGNGGGMLHWNAAGKQWEKEQ